MPMPIHSHADLGQVTSALRPLIPHLRTRDGNIFSSGRGGEERRLQKAVVVGLNSVLIKYSETSR